jgi:2,5-diamino-6-(ribosylamino)-4(3H)-pyrimidinone 5'-phosphate reductase
MQAERPFVLINTAVTADGKIDTADRRGAAISSAADLERVDRLRAGSDAVMVGGNTLLQEDPKLTVKLEELRAARLGRGLSENPLKVGVVTKVEDPLVGPTIISGGKFLTFGPARTVVITTAQTDATQIERLRAGGAEVYVEGKHRVDLGEALRRLRELGVKRLMVEGGGTLNAELLRLRLVDELHLYIAPVIFGGATAPTVADGLGLSVEEAVRLTLLGLEQLEDGGIVVRYGVMA